MGFVETCHGASLHILFFYLPAVKDKSGQIERNVTNSRYIRENIHLSVQGVIGSKMIGDDVRQIMRREKVDDDENENHRDGKHRRASFDQHKDIARCPHLTLKGPGLRNSR